MRPSRNSQIANKNYLVSVCPLVYIEIVVMTEDEFADAVKSADVQLDRSRSILVQLQESRESTMYMIENFHAKIAEFQSAAYTPPATSMPESRQTENEN